MAAQKWSPLSKVTGKYTEEHFELVNIPPKLKSSEETISWASSVTSSTGAKLNNRKRNFLTNPYTEYKKPNCIYSDIGPQSILPDGSSEPISKPFHSADCIYGGSLVMRVSTESSRKNLEHSNRSLSPVLEQSCTVCNQKSLTPTPSIISAIVDTEFVAHKQRKQRKLFENQQHFRQNLTTQPAICLTYNHKHPKKRKDTKSLKPSDEEKFKIKIEHHRDMVVTQSEEKTNTDSLHSFRGKISKLRNNSLFKLSSNILSQSVDRKSTFSFQSSNDFVVDERDYLKKTKTHTPSESFSLLPSSEDESDSSESSKTTKSFCSTDDSTFIISKQLRDHSFVEKHRKRCEALLKEAEKRKYECRSKITHDEHSAFYCTAIPTPYFVEVSEGAINKVKELKDAGNSIDNTKMTVSPTIEEGMLPISNKINHENDKPMINITEKLIKSPTVVDKKTSPIAECIHKSKIEELTKRLSDWKTNSSKVQKESTKTVLKKKAESKSNLRAPGSSREHNTTKPTKEIKPKRPQHSEQKVNCKHDLTTANLIKKQGVLSKVIPGWLKVFGVKNKPEEHCKSTKKEFGTTQNKQTLFAISKNNKKKAKPKS